MGFLIASTALPTCALLGLERLSWPPGPLKLMASSSPPTWKVCSTRVLLWADALSGNNESG